MGNYKSPVQDSSAATAGDPDVLEYVIARPQDFDDIWKISIPAPRAAVVFQAADTVAEHLFAVAKIFHDSESGNAVGERTRDVLLLQRDLQKCNSVYEKMETCDLFAETTFHAWRQWRARAFYVAIEYPEWLQYKEGLPEEKLEEVKALAKQKESKRRTSSTSASAGITTISGSAAAAVAASLEDDKRAPELQEGEELTLPLREGPPGDHRGAPEVDRSKEDPFGVAVTPEQRREEQKEREFAFLRAIEDTNPYRLQQYSASVEQRMAFARNEHLIGELCPFLSRNVEENICMRANQLTQMKQKIFKELRESQQILPEFGTRYMLKWMRLVLRKFNDPTVLAKKRKTLRAEEEAARLRTTVAGAEASQMSSRDEEGIDVDDEDGKCDQERTGRRAAMSFAYEGAEGEDGETSWNDIFPGDLCEPHVASRILADQCMRTALVYEEAARFHRRKLELEFCRERADEIDEKIESNIVPLDFDERKDEAWRANYNAARHGDPNKWVLIVNPRKRPPTRLQHLRRRRAERIAGPCAPPVDLRVKSKSRKGPRKTTKGNSEQEEEAPAERGELSAEDGTSADDKARRGPMVLVKGRWKLPRGREKVLLRSESVLPEFYRESKWKYVKDRVSHYCLCSPRQPRRGFVDPRDPDAGYYYRWYHDAQLGRHVPTVQDRMSQFKRLVYLQEVHVEGLTKQHERQARMLHRVTKNLTQPLKEEMAKVQKKAEEAALAAGEDGDPVVDHALGFRQVKKHLLRGGHHGNSAKRLRVVSTGELLALEDAAKRLAHLEAEAQLFVFRLAAERRCLAELKLKQQGFSRTFAFLTGVDKKHLRQLPRRNARLLLLRDEIERVHDLVAPIFDVAKIHESDHRGRETRARGIGEGLLDTLLLRGGGGFRADLRQHGQSGFPTTTHEVDHEAKIHQDEVLVTLADVYQTGAFREALRRANSVLLAGDKYKSLLRVSEPLDEIWAQRKNAHRRITVSFMDPFADKDGGRVLKAKAGEHQYDNPDDAKELLEAKLAIPTLDFRDRFRSLMCYPSTPFSRLLGSFRTRKGYFGPDTLFQPDFGGAAPRQNLALLDYAADEPYPTTGGYYDENLQGYFGYDQLYDEGMLPPYDDPYNVDDQFLAQMQNFSNYELHINGNVINDALQHDPFQPGAAGGGSEAAPPVASDGFSENIDSQHLWQDEEIEKIRCNVFRAVQKDIRAREEVENRTPHDNPIRDDRGRWVVKPYFDTNLRKWIQGRYDDRGRYFEGYDDPETKTFVRICSGYWRTTPSTMQTFVRRGGEEGRSFSKRKRSKRKVKFFDVQLARQWARAEDGRAAKEKAEKSCSGAEDGSHSTETRNDEEEKEQDEFLEGGAGEHRNKPPPPQFVHAYWDGYGNCIECVWNKYEKVWQERTREYTFLPGDWNYAGQAGTQAQPNAARKREPRIVDAGRWIVLTRTYFHPVHRCWITKNSRGLIRRRGPMPIRDTPSIESPFVGMELAGKRAFLHSRRFLDLDVADNVLNSTAPPHEFLRKLLRESVLGEDSWKLVSWRVGKCFLTDAERKFLQWLFFQPHDTPLDARKSHPRYEPLEDKIIVDGLRNGDPLFLLAQRADAVEGEEPEPLRRQKRRMEMKRPTSTCEARGEAEADADNCCSNNTSNSKIECSSDFSTRAYGGQESFAESEQKEEGALHAAPATAAAGRYHDHSETGLVQPRDAKLCDFLVRSSCRTRRGCIKAFIDLVNRRIEEAHLAARKRYKQLLEKQYVEELCLRQAVCEQLLEEFRRIDERQTSNQRKLQRARLKGLPDLIRQEIAKQIFEEYRARVENIEEDCSTIVAEDDVASVLLPANEIGNETSFSLLTPGRELHATASKRAQKANDTTDDDEQAENLWDSRAGNAPGQHGDEEEWYAYDENGSRTVAVGKYYVDENTGKRRKWRDYNDGKYDQVIKSLRQTAPEACIAGELRQRLVARIRSASTTTRAIKRIPPILKKRYQIPNKMLQDEDHFTDVDIVDLQRRDNLLNDWVARGMPVSELHAICVNLLDVGPMLEGCLTEEQCSLPARISDEYNIINGLTRDMAEFDSWWKTCQASLDSVNKEVRNLREALGGKLSEEYLEFLRCGGTRSAAAVELPPSTSWQRPFAERAARMNRTFTIRQNPRRGEQKNTKSVTKTMTPAEQLFETVRQRQLELNLELKNRLEPYFHKHRRRCASSRRRSSKSQQRPLSRVWMVERIMCEYTLMNGEIKDRASNEIDERRKWMQYLHYSLSENGTGGGREAVGKSLASCSAGARAVFLKAREEQLLGTGRTVRTGEDEGKCKEGGMENADEIFQDGVIPKLRERFHQCRDPFEAHLLSVLREFEKHHNGAGFGAGPNHPRRLAKQMNVRGSYAATEFARRPNKQKARPRLAALRQYGRKFGRGEENLARGANDLDGGRTLLKKPHGFAGIAVRRADQKQRRLVRGVPALAAAHMRERLSMAAQEDQAGDAGWSHSLHPDRWEATIADLDGEFFQNDVLFHVDEDDRDCDAAPGKPGLRERLRLPEVVENRSRSQTQSLSQRATTRFTSAKSNLTDDEEKQLIQQLLEFDFVPLRHPVKTLPENPLSEADFGLIDEVAAGKDWKSLEVFVNTMEKRIPEYFETMEAVIYGCCDPECKRHLRIEIEAEKIDLGEIAVADIQKIGEEQMRAEEVKRGKLARDLKVAEEFSALLRSFGEDGKEMRFVANVLRLDRTNASLLSQALLLVVAEEYFGGEQISAPGLHLGCKLSRAQNLNSACPISLADHLRLHLHPNFAHVPILAPDAALLPSMTVIDANYSAPAEDLDSEDDRAARQEFEEKLRAEYRTHGAEAEYGVGDQPAGVAARWLAEQKQNISKMDEETLRRLEEEVGAADCEESDPRRLPTKNGEEEFVERNRGVHEVLTDILQHQRKKFTGKFFAGFDETLKRWDAPAAAAPNNRQHVPSGPTCTTRWRIWRRLNDPRCTINREQLREMQRAAENDRRHHDASSITTAPLYPLQLALRTPALRTGLSKYLLDLTHLTQLSFQLLPTGGPGSNDPEAVHIHRQMRIVKKNLLQLEQFHEEVVMPKRLKGNDTSDEDGAEVDAPDRKGSAAGDAPGCGSSFIGEEATASNFGEKRLAALVSLFAEDCWLRLGVFAKRLAFGGVCGKALELLQMCEDHLAVFREAEARTTAKAFIIGDRLSDDGSWEFSSESSACSAASKNLPFDGLLKLKRTNRRPHGARPPRKDHAKLWKQRCVENRMATATNWKAYCQTIIAKKKKEKDKQVLAGDGEPVAVTQHQSEALYSPSRGAGAGSRRVATTLQGTPDTGERRRGASLSEDSDSDSIDSDDWIAQSRAYFAAIKQREQKKERAMAIKNDGFWRDEAEDERIRKRAGRLEASMDKTTFCTPGGLLRIRSLSSMPLRRIDFVAEFRSARIRLSGAMAAAGEHTARSEHGEAAGAAEAGGGHENAEDAVARFCRDDLNGAQLLNKAAAGAVDERELGHAISLVRFLHPRRQRALNRRRLAVSGFVEATTAADNFLVKASANSENIDRELELRQLLVAHENAKNCHREKLHRWKKLVVERQFHTSSRNAGRLFTLDSRNLVDHDVEHTARTSTTRCELGCDPESFFLYADHGEYTSSEVEEDDACSYDSSCPSSDMSSLASAHEAEGPIVQYMLKTTGAISNNRGNDHYDKNNADQMNVRWNNYSRSGATDLAGLSNGVLAKVSTQQDQDESTGEHEHHATELGPRLLLLQMGVGSMTALERRDHLEHIKAPGGTISAEIRYDRDCSGDWPRNKVTCDDYETDSGCSEECALLELAQAVALVNQRFVVDVESQLARKRRKRARAAERRNKADGNINNNANGDDTGGAVVTTPAGRPAFASHHTRYEKYWAQFQQTVHKKQRERDAYYRNTRHSMKPDGVRKAWRGMHEGRTAEYSAARERTAAEIHEITERGRRMFMDPAVVKTLVHRKKQKQPLFGRKPERPPELATHFLDEVRPLPRFCVHTHRGAFVEPGTRRHGIEDHSDPNRGVDGETSSSSPTLDTTMTSRESGSGNDAASRSSDSDYCSSSDLSPTQYKQLAYKGTGALEFRRGFEENEIFRNARNSSRRAGNLLRDGYSRPAKYRWPIGVRKVDDAARSDGAVDLSSRRESPAAIQAVAAQPSTFKNGRDFYDPKTYRGKLLSRKFVQSCVQIVEPTSGEDAGEQRKKKVLVRGLHFVFDYGKDLFADAGAVRNESEAPKMKVPEEGVENEDVLGAVDKKKKTSEQQPSSSPSAGGSEREGEGNQPRVAPQQQRLTYVPARPEAVAVRQEHTVDWSVPMFRRVVDEQLLQLYKIYWACSESLFPEAGAAPRFDARRWWGRLQAAERMALIAVSKEDMQEYFYSRSCSTTASKGSERDEFSTDSDEAESFSCAPSGARVFLPRPRHLLRRIITLTLQKLLDAQGRLQHLRAAYQAPEQTYNDTIMQRLRADRNRRIATRNFKAAEQVSKAKINASFGKYTRKRKRAEASGDTDVPNSDAAKKEASKWAERCNTVSEYKLEQFVAGEDHEASDEGDDAVVNDKAVDEEEREDVGDDSAEQDCASTTLRRPPKSAEGPKNLKADGSSGHASSSSSCNESQGGAPCKTKQKIPQQFLEQAREEKKGRLLMRAAVKRIFMDLDFRRVSKKDKEKKIYPPAHHHDQVPGEYGATTNDAALAKRELQAEDVRKKPKWAEELAGRRTYLHLARGLLCEQRLREHAATEFLAKQSGLLLLSPESIMANELQVRLVPDVFSLKETKKNSEKFTWLSTSPQRLCSSSLENARADADQHQIQGECNKKRDPVDEDAADSDKARDEVQGFRFQSLAPQSDGKELDARGEEGDGEEGSSERACTSQEDSEDSEAERRREKKRKQQQEADTLAALRVCPATAFHLRRLDLEDRAKLENQKQKDDDNEFNVAGMSENEKKQFEMTFRDQQIEATEMGVKDAGDLFSSDPDSEFSVPDIMQALGSGGRKELEPPEYPKRINWKKASEKLERAGAAATASLSGITKDGRTTRIGDDNAGSYRLRPLPETQKTTPARPELDLKLHEQRRGARTGPGKE
eukprot:g5617.t1